MACLTTPRHATPDAAHCGGIFFAWTGKWNNEKVSEDETEKKKETRIQNELVVTMRLNHFLTQLIKNKFYIVNYINCLAEDFTIFHVVWMYFINKKMADT